MKLALVDFDGTLFDFSESLKAAALELTGKPLSSKEVTMLPREIKKEIYDLNITQYKNLYRPYSKVVEFIENLRGEGFTIKILTARPCNRKNHLRELLDSINFSDEIICRPDLLVEDEDYKLSFIKKMGAEKILLLEDKLDNIIHIKKSLPEIKAYLIEEGKLTKV